MTKAEIIALAERVERAEGPDRWLDSDIALSQGWHQLPGDNWIGPHAEIVVPDYTASLDAAMTLVPSGFLWTMDSWDGSRWSAGIWRDRRWLVHTSEKRTSKTPALALTSASLRAIAEGMEDEG